MKKRQKVIEAKASFLPEVIETEASEGSRRNSSSTSDPLSRFENIKNAGMVPFRTGGGNVNVKEAIELCQKAYYNFAIIRNVIEIMTEFSISNIYFRDGTAKAKRFFQEWLKVIKINSLQDNFFRERYRSGNIFIYKIKGKIREEDLNQINTVYNTNASKVNLPVKYIILNPASIHIQNNYSFGNNVYYKTLSPYEIDKIKKPETQQEKNISETLLRENPNLFKDKSLKLKPEDISVVFSQKQDYEPFAVPLVYPVLDDLNWKTEMKKMDMAVMQTMQQCILLVTQGTEPEKGGINQNALNKLTDYFKNPSVGRVLVSDYTTDIKFVIPQVSDLLNPEKYEIIDRDIQQGLNNILIGDEKFANQSIKVKIFIERLKQARQAFLDEFLIPEMESVAREIGFRSYPTPYFQDFDLSDDAEKNKLYLRLTELGLLTPKEAITAINDGILPESEESIENQKEFKSLKNEGLYEPTLNKPKDQAGRPEGTGKPLPNKTVGPITASFSLKKLNENLIKYEDLKVKTASFLKKKYKVKEFNAEQDKLSNELTEVIVANETPEKWEESITKYFESPFTPKINNEILEIAAEKDLNFLDASILYHSKI